MEKIINKITVDLYGPTLRRHMEANQGERGIRTVKVTIRKNGGTFQPDETADYIAQIQRPDGKTVFVQGTLQHEGNTVDFTVPGNALCVAGIAVAEIVINKAENEESMITQSWEIVIQPKHGGANALESSDHLVSMEERIAANTAMLERLIQGQRAMYSFEINEEGHLILTYEGEDPPRYYIDGRGHLMIGVEDGNEIDLGQVTQKEE